MEITKQTEKKLSILADWLTNKYYVGRGVFGGQAKASKGAIVSKKLFDWQTARTQILKKITEQYKQEGQVKIKGQKLL